MASSKHRTERADSKPAPYFKVLQNLEGMDADTFRALREDRESALALLGQLSEDVKGKSRGYLPARTRKRVACLIAETGLRAPGAQKGSTPRFKADYQPDIPLETAKTGDVVKNCGEKWEVRAYRAFGGLEFDVYRDSALEMQDFPSLEEAITYVRSQKDLPDDRED